VEPAASDDTCTAERVGGSATFGLARATSSLDPTVALGSGVAGGIEIAAIFDTLILYDAANGTYLPHVAESVSTDEDLTVWTVKLRPGITFGNGDPLTTEAVKFSFERMKTAKVSSAGLAAAIVDMEIVDDLTIVFTLNGPSASFLYVLAEDAGNITNPNVVNAMTPEEFSLNPNGAGVGPYEVESFVPNEKLVLRAKDDYWGGPVCIETLTMTYVAGAAATYDAFTLGELDMAFMRGAPLEVAKLRADGVKLQGAVTNGETVMILNVGREGTNSPVQDVRLRQAIAAAIDVDLIDERINEGAGIPGTALVADSEGWSPGVPGPQYDPTLAETLVAEVKADGWDGKLTLVSNDSPQQAVDTAILVQGLLEAVGMEITVENLPAGEVSTRVITDADFDLAFFGISALEDAPTARDRVRNTRDGRRARGAQSGPHPRRQEGGHGEDPGDLESGRALDHHRPR
jgi:peptide/nickel transport system substrate-binding protein